MVYRSVLQSAAMASEPGEPRAKKLKACDNAGAANSAVRYSACSFFLFFSNIYPDLRCQQRLSSFEEQRCYKAIPGRRRTCRPSDEFDAFHLQSGTHGRAVGNDEGGAWRTTSLCYSRASHRRQELQEYH